MRSDLMAIPPRGRRAATALAAGLAVLVGATGCNTLQGERPDPKVLVLTVEEGLVTFM